eukprot:GEMP01085282.1.p1 GENE.GEMP01085282.1~~GEMP01085282.1.p1  ORF type:complete len:113 (-),score=8.04 GEMP01085282.1:95-433(-)
MCAWYLPSSPLLKKTTIYTTSTHIIFIAMCVSTKNTQCVAAKSRREKGGPSFDIAPCPARQRPKCLPDADKNCLQKKKTPFYGAKEFIRNCLQTLTHTHTPHFIAKGNEFYP